jgi:hypothetical protein
MKKLAGVKLVCVTLSIPVLALAAVDGVVINQTTSKPQPGATVTLIRLGNAMNTTGSVTTDAQGKFRIEQDLQADSPHLLQAMHQGVTYNTMLAPGSASTGVELKVYDSSANAPDAKVTQHMMLVESNGSEVAISETVIFENTGKITFNTPNGTLPVYIQPEVKTPVRVMVQAPQGMPIQRSAEKAKAPNTYVVKYPIRPGETRIDLSYSLPAATKFDSRVLHGGPVRIVAPTGIKLQGEGLVELGNEPRTQAMVYDVKGTALAFTVQGTGSLRESAGGARESGGATGGEEDTGPGIDQVKPRIYKRIEAVLALSLIMLAIGFVLLYRSNLNTPDAGKRA